MSGGGLGGVDDDVGGGRLGPVAGASEASESANGAEDGESGRLIDVFHGFEDLFHGGTKILAAAFDEPESASVAIDGGVGDFEFTGNAFCVAPVKEFGFEEFAFGMVADSALA